MNIDSQDFRELPAEVQHEIIVEMHEKSKRHSRYQAIDMPEVQILETYQVAFQIYKYFLKL